MAKRSQKKKTSSHRIFNEVPAERAGASRPLLQLNRNWLWGSVLVGAIFLVYLPVWHASFFWDDDLLVTSNPCIVGPLGIKEIWTTQAADICPLTLTTFWVEHALWGLRPLPYHLVNVSAHAVCAILLWQVLRQLKIGGSWLGAAIWALHPIEVESVAWISELKNVQSGVFYLLTILFYVKGLRSNEKNDRNRRSHHALTLFFALLAMASKSSTVILPVVLCICAWWVEGRWHWRNLGKVAPIFIMSLIAGIISMWTQNLAGANDSESTRSWPERLVTAGDAVWFYLGKLLWPHPLIPIYPRWQPDAEQFSSYVPLLGILIVLCVLWSKRHTVLRPYFYSLFYFVIALSPTLGLINNYFFRFSFVADHFQYLAAMGPLALVGAGLSQLPDIILWERLRIKVMLSAGIMLVLGALSWKHACAYQDKEMLWNQTLAENPMSWVAYNNLGLILFEKGDWDQAESRFEQSLVSHPGFDLASNNLGSVYLKKGLVDKAKSEFEEAIHANNRYAEAYNNLGLTDVQKGQLDQAIEQFESAVKINPYYRNAYNNLGFTLEKRGLINEAIVQFKKTLELDPQFTHAHESLGSIYQKRGQIDDAIAEYQKVLEIDPSRTEVAMSIGGLFLQEGKPDRAVEFYQKALAGNPHTAGVHYDLGNAFSQMRRLDDAISEYKIALSMNPGYVEVYNNLGIALAREGKMDEAIVQFQEAVQLNPNFRAAQNNLAKAKIREQQGTSPH